MLSTILHWTCDPTSASMASLLFRWAIALAMLPYGVQKLFHPEIAANFPKVLFFSPGRLPHETGSHSGKR